MGIIPYGKQDITDEDITSVIEVLKSDFLTQGPKIREFEEAFSKYVSSKYAVAVSNGTAALHLSCLSIGLKKGDKVITSTLTFSASANCALYCGAEVIFSDIDSKTYLLDLNFVEDVLRKDKKNSVKAIIPVNFAGLPVDIEALSSICEKRGVKIIEDACHAPGGYFYNKNKTLQLCGNGNYSDATIFSFHPVKHIATGEGGMITTNNDVIYKKAINLRSHGITKISSEFQRTAKGINVGIVDESYPAWYMEMQSLGFNYRLSDISAALGLSQLSRAKKMLLKRIFIANRYYNELKDLEEIVVQNPSLFEGHAYHLFVIQAKKRNELYAFLREKKILTQVHYIPVHMMPFYVKRNGLVSLKNAEAYFKECLSLPMYPTLKNEEQTYVIDSIKKFYS